MHVVWAPEGVQACYPAASFVFPPMPSTGEMKSRQEWLELHVGWRNRDSGEFRPVIRLPPPRRETLSLGVLTQPIGAYET